MRETKKFDWTAVSTGAPPPLEPGLYKAKFVKNEVQTSSKGNRMLNCRLDIFESETGEKLKRVTFDRFVFVSKALRMVRDACEALNIEPPGINVDGEGEVVQDETLEEAIKYLDKALVRETKSGGVWVRLDIDPYTDPRSGEQKQKNIVKAYLGEGKLQEAKSDSTANGHGGAAEAAPTVRRRSSSSTAQA